MKRLRLARAASCAAGFAVLAATTVSLASTAAADYQFLTVSGTVHCVNQSYTLTVPAVNIQSGISSYVFLDGTTQIGNQQNHQRGQDATATWTPTTAGKHNLFMRGFQTNGGIIIGPTAVTVEDQTSPDCSTGGGTGGTGSADSLPVIGPLLAQLGL